MFASTQGSWASHVNRASNRSPVPSRPRRDIVRDEGFEASLQYLFHHWQKAERYIAAAEEVLALDATFGTPCGDGYWILPMAPVDGADVWLIYTYYDTVVVLMEVKAYWT